MLKDTDVLKHDHYRATSTNDPGVVKSNSEADSLISNSETSSNISNIFSQEPTMRQGSDVSNPENSSPKAQPFNYVSSKNDFEKGFGNEPVKPVP